MRSVRGVIVRLVAEMEPVPVPSGRHHQRLAEPNLLRQEAAAKMPTAGSPPPPPPPPLLLLLLLLLLHLQCLTVHHLPLLR